MKTFLFILTLLLMFTVQIVNAESNAKTKKSVSAKKSDQKYITAEIDINLEKLPENYFGNNPITVYKQIKKRNESKVKDEFETTAQFKTRLEKDEATPIIGKITTSGLFTFKSDDYTISYSADESEFIIDIDLGLQQYITYPALGRSDDINSIHLKKVVTSDRYFGSNTYGATAEVTSTLYESYYAAITNFGELPSELISDNYHLKTKLKVTPNDAKKIKNNVNILFIGKLNTPFIIRNVRYSPDATINSPFESKTYSYFIFMNVFEIWIYNQESGQIYTKIKKQTEKEELTGSRLQNPNSQLPAPLRNDSNGEIQAAH